MSNLEEKDIVPMNDSSDQNIIINIVQDQLDYSEHDLPDLIPADINNEVMEVEEIKEVHEEKKTSENREEKENIQSLDYINEEDNYQNDSEQMNRQLDANAEPGECPFGDECPVKNAIDNNISPNYVRYDPNIRDHIYQYHRYLNFLFSREYSQIRREINFINSIFEATGISNGNFRNTSHNEDEENANTKCGRCDNYYDHEEHSKFFLSCCDNKYCMKCIRELTEKEERCLSCKSNLEYLKDIKIPEKKSVAKDGTDCFICCDTMNTTQYNGKVTLDCKCKFELCLSCAYKSLQDTKHIKIEEVQGIEGLVLPQNYTIEGACPNCRGIPNNKEELISLYGFLPPRH